MAPPKVSSWVLRRTPTSLIETRVRMIDYDNRVVIFVCQGQADRISSYIEVKRKTGALSGFEDVETSVLLGDRNDIWGQLIARRAMDILKRDVLIGFGLLKDSKSETSTKEVSQIVNEAIQHLTSN